MKKNINALVLAAIIGLLIVAVGLGFLFGPANPVPWILIGVLITIVVVYRWISSRDRVEWKESYTVGVDDLDDEALNELVDYTKYHFEREEKMMEEAGYPDLAAHKEIHQTMIAKVEEFQEEYQRTGHEALEGVATFLSEWLINHINGIDKKYGPYVSRRQTSV